MMSETAKTKKKRKKDNHGNFSLVGPVTTDAVSSLTASMSRWARKPSNHDKPITLTICSEGGHVYAGLWLHDHLRMLSVQGHRVTTVIRGQATSIAGVIAQAGDFRIIGARSYLHLHEAANLIHGKTHELRDEAAAQEELNQAVAELYAERSSLKAHQIHEKFERREWWVPAKEALALGFVDAIG